MHERTDVPHVHGAASAIAQSRTCRAAVNAILRAIDANARAVTLAIALLMMKGVRWKGIMDGGSVQNPRGFSLVEATIILGVLSIIGAVATPSIGDYVSQARAVRARADAQVIAVAVVRLVFDVGRQSRNQSGWTTYDLLVGEGAIPALGEAGDAAWLRPAGSPKVGLLADHLVTNVASYTTSLVGRTLSIRGWHGPYLEAGVGPDPWGHRYAVNIRYLGESSNFDTIVLSAGPNGADDTRFEVDGITPGADDVIALISGQ